MKKSLNIKDMVVCAVFTAFCCVCSMITLPVGVIPITFAVFAVMLTAMVLDTKNALISVVLFIVLGCIGIPVFSGMQGGIGVLAGPSGGYIYSYILMVPIISMASKCLNKSVSSGMFTFLGCIVAIAVNYIVATAHFLIVMNAVNGKDYSLWSALCTCAFSFIPFDILKSIVAIIVAQRIRPLLKNK